VREIRGRKSPRNGTGKVKPYWQREVSTYVSTIQQEEGRNPKKVSLDGVYLLRGKWPQKQPRPFLQRYSFRGFGKGRKERGGIPPESQILNRTAAGEKKQRRRRQSDLFDSELGSGILFSTSRVRAKSAEGVRRRGRGGTLPLQRGKTKKSGWRD